MAKTKAPRFHCSTCKRLSASRTSFAGKQALREIHRALLRVDVDCSFNIEYVGASEQRVGEKLFDYGVVVRPNCELRFLEVHPAATSNVNDLIEKKRGTERVLSCVGVNTTGASWHWLVPEHSPIKFKANDAYGKRVAAARISQPQRYMSR